MLHHFLGNNKALLSRPAPASPNCQSPMTRSASPHRLVLHQSLEHCGRKALRHWRRSQVSYHRAQAPLRHQGADLRKWRASATCLRNHSTQTCPNVPAARRRIKILTPWLRGADLSQSVSWGRGVGVEEEGREVGLEETVVEVQGPGSTQLILIRGASSLPHHTRGIARGEGTTTVTHLSSFNLRALTRTHIHTSQTHPFCSWVQVFCTTVTVPRLT